MTTFIPIILSLSYYHYHIITIIDYYYHKSYDYCHKLYYDNHIGITFLIGTVTRAVYSLISGHAPKRQYFLRRHWAGAYRSDARSTSAGALGFAESLVVVDSENHGDLSDFKHKKSRFFAILQERFSHFPWHNVLWLWRNWDLSTNLYQCSSKDRS